MSNNNQAAELIAVSASVAAGAALVAAAVASAPVSGPIAAIGGLVGGVGVMLPFTGNSKSAEPTYDETLAEIKAANKTRLFKAYINAERELKIARKAYKNVPKDSHPSVKANLSIIVCDANKAFMNAEAAFKAL